MRRIAVNVMNGNGKDEVFLFLYSIVCNVSCCLIFDMHANRFGSPRPVTSQIALWKSFDHLVVAVVS